jgi:hypothetical protein
MQECCTYGSMRGALGQLASLPRLVDGRGLPLGNYLHSASPAEVRLAETTLASIRVGRRHRAGRPRQKPLRVIADKAYDSDPLRKRLRQRGIELICPHKTNRVRPATQDGRALRPLAPNLPGVLSYRPLHDRLTKGCAIGSRKHRSLHCAGILHFRAGFGIGCPGSVQMIASYGD